MPYLLFRSLKQVFDIHHMEYWSWYDVSHGAEYF